MILTCQWPAACRQHSRLLLYITSLVEYNSGRKFRVTTRNPYRVRTHRIRIWCCFFQSLGNVCCDVTWVSPSSTLCSFVSVSSCFHPPNIIPLLPLHPMDPLSKDSIETADHFIYVTQVYFCGTYSFHLTSPPWNSSEDFIAMCTASTPSLFSRFF